MIIRLSLKFEINMLCLKVSRTLLKNDDTLLEFRRTWRFLTEAGVLDHVLDVSFDNVRVKFQILKKSVKFEGVKNPPEE